MNLIEIYDRINNPLNEEEVRRLITLASLNDSMHNKIMNLNKKNNSRIIQADKDRMNEEMFASWKEGIIALSKEDTVKLFEEHKIDDDFVSLRNFVCSNKDKSYSEFMEALKEAKLDKLYDRYRWDSKDLDGPWRYVVSDKFFSHKHKPFEAEHRLYINTNAEDTYMMANLFREKCDKKNIPYFFKLSESPVRDDSIVIYASSRLLEEYMKVLSEIKKEEPNLISRINNPPVLTGKMGFVGYGSEPIAGNDGRSKSFFKVRTDIIDEVIYRKSREWFLHNKDLNLNGVTIEDAIVKESTSRIIDSMRRKYNDTVEYEKETANRVGTKFNEDLVKEKLGYSNDILDGIEVKEAISNVVRKNIVAVLENKKLFEYTPFTEAFHIFLDNGKRFPVYYHDISRLIKQSISGIPKFDNTFASKVLEDIKDKAHSQGMDPEKICFDLERVRALRKYSEGAITASDIRHEDLKFPTFEELKEYAMKYRVQYDEKEKRLKVYEIDSNNEETNAIKAQDALFANIWLTSAGLQKVAGEQREGISAAFNEDARKVYEYFIKGSEHSISKTGDLNSLFLFKNASSLGVPSDEEIVARLFGNDNQSMFLDNYVQNRCNSSLHKNRMAQTLSDTDTARTMLEEMMASAAEEKNGKKK